jgi:hypothetical protein
MDGSTIATLLTVFVASPVLAAVVASLMTARSSGKEKMWEVRRQAYGAILSELLAAERLYRVADKFIAQDEMRYFSSDDYHSHRGAIAQYMDGARQRYSDDYLILSDGFAREFDQLLADYEAWEPNEDPPEEFERLAHGLRRRRATLLRIGRGEVTVPRQAGWRRLLAWFERPWRTRPQHPVTSSP